MLDSITTFFFNIFEPLLHLIAKQFPVVNPSQLPFFDSIDLIMETGWQFSFIIPYEALFITLAFYIMFNIIIIGIQFSIFFLAKTMDFVAQLIPF